MLRTLCLLLLSSSLSQQAHAIDPIQDGQVIGPLVQVQEAFTSLFLLDPGDGTAVLFDAGTTPFGGAMLAALAAIGVAPAQVTDVFITHGHGDHIAGLGLLPSARVHAMAAEIPLIEAEGFRVTDPHLDGDVVVAGGFSVEIFAAPGHTPGSAVYLVGGVLVMGDTVFADNGRLRPNSFVGTGDPALNIQSLRQLIARLEPRFAEIDWAAPSHTAPVGGGALRRAD